MFNRDRAVVIDLFYSFMPSSVCCIVNFGWSVRCFLGLTDTAKKAIACHHLEGKEERKVSLSDLDEICNHAERLKATVHVSTCNKAKHKKYSSRNHITAVQLNTYL